MKFSLLITFYAVSLLILSGCGKPKPKQEESIDATLPVIQLTKNGIVVDTTAVAFEWHPIEDKRVKGIYVYKHATVGTKTDDEYYDTIDNRYVTHYVDDKVLPDTKYGYYFKTFSDKAQSVKSKTDVISSLPVLESVSWIYAKQNMPRCAKIIWRPHTNEKVKAYIIERKTIDSKKWKVIDTVERRLSAEYIDEGLEDKQVYKYRIRVLTYDGITSTPSKTVKIVTKALPKIVMNIQATRNLPKKIKITWDKTDTKDFAFYNLYRSEDVDGGYKLIAKLKKNYYTDKCNEDGKQYFYRVSVKDKDGLESKHGINSIQGLTLLKPNPPAVVEVKFINNKVKVVWSGVDSRTKTYTISKRYKKSWHEEITEDFTDIRTREFIDLNIKPNNIYYYKVYSVDKNGVKSKASKEVEVESKMVELLDSSPMKFSSEQGLNKEVVESDTIIPVQDFN